MVWYGSTHSKCSFASDEFCNESAFIFPMFHCMVGELSHMSIPRGWPWKTNIFSRGNLSALPLCFAPVTVPVTVRISTVIVDLLRCADFTDLLKRYTKSCPRMFI
jgi:hypothetical protein